MEYKDINKLKSPHESNQIKLINLHFTHTVIVNTTEIV